MSLNVQFTGCREREMTKMSHLSGFIDHVVQELQLVLTLLLVGLVDDLLSQKMKLSFV